MKKLTSVTVPSEFKLPADAPQAACLAVFNRQDGAMFKIPLTEKELGDIWKDCSQPGALAFKEFFAAAVREKIARREKWEAEQEFEAAARKAICLIDLLLSKLIADADTELYVNSSSYDEEKTQAICGLQDLAFPVTKALTAGLCGNSKAGTEVAS